MKLPQKQIGPATIYGEWDDVQDYQFVVIWGEAGPYCTVLLCSGCDYGGGITSGSDTVPVKEAEDIVNAEYDWMGAAKELMEKLVARSK